MDERAFRLAESLWLGRLSTWDTGREWDAYAGLLEWLSQRPSPMLVPLAVVWPKPTKGSRA